MECSKENIYFLIESLRRNGMSGSEIHHILENAWPNEALSLRRVQTILKEYNDGDRTSFVRESGSGRRKSDERMEGINKIREALEEDCTRTVRDLASDLQMPKTMVHRIVTEDLQKKWVLTNWIPYPVMEDRKAVRVERITDLLETFESRIALENLVTIDEKWFYCRHLRPKNKIGCWISPGGDQIQTARRAPMEKKFMAIVAISLRGHHFFKVLDRNQSVTSLLYIQFLNDMEAAFAEFPHPIRWRNMRLIHDNARPHTSHETTNFLLDKGVRLLKQPPYSPDCNMCDRYLFPRLEALRKVDYATKEELEDFLREQLPNFHGHRMKAALEDMRQDMQLIVQKGGDYL